MGLFLEEQLYEGGIGWGLGVENGCNSGDPLYEMPCPSCSGLGCWGDDIPYPYCSLGRQVVMVKAMEPTDNPPSQEIR